MFTAENDKLIGDDQNKTQDPPVVAKTKTVLLGTRTAQNPWIAVFLHTIDRQLTGSRQAVYTHCIISTQITMWTVTGQYEHMHLSRYIHACVPTCECLYKRLRTSLYTQAIAVIVLALSAIAACVPAKMELSQTPHNMVEFVYLLLETDQQRSV